MCTCPLLRSCSVLFRAKCPAWDVSIFVVFWSIGGRFGSIFGRFSVLLWIRDRFPDGFSATFAGLRRVGAGMVPGYAVGLRYFFSGVPLGYGDLRAAI